MKSLKNAIPEHLKRCVHDEVLYKSTFTFTLSLRKKWSAFLVLPFLASVWGRGTPLPPCPFTCSSFPPFYFSLSFVGFTYFLLLSIPSLTTRIVPLRFQAGGRRK